MRWATDFAADGKIRSQVLINNVSLGDHENRI
jgi:hypothetical protein